MAVYARGERTGGQASKPRKMWIRTQQNWTWIITIVWMTVANLWHPFGLYGFICMFTPIFIALFGWGKMSCARICPRGSFLGVVVRRVSLGRATPVWMHTKRFRFILWAVMMGTFAALMVWAIPKGIETLGFTVLVFMEAATALAVLAGILFKPRSWCTICPMGTTSGKIRDWRKK